MTKNNKKLLSLILSTMLIVAMAFSMTACGDKQDPSNGDAKVETEIQADASIGFKTLGEGETRIILMVVDKDLNEAVFEIYTDETTVGDALLKLGLIEGEESEFGLYVKTVNGITADYDVDQTYWAFYIDGEMALSGVDATEVKRGTIYTLRVEE